MIIKMQKNQEYTKCFICKKKIFSGDQVTVVPKENGQLFMVHDECAKEIDEDD